MFVSHRDRSWEVADFTVSDRLRIKVFEGDFYPEPDHELVFILDGQVVDRRLVGGYRAAIADIEANVDAVIETLVAKVKNKSAVEKAWDKGGFGKPI